MGLYIRKLKRYLEKNNITQAKAAEIMDFKARESMIKSLQEGNLQIKRLELFSDHFDIPMAYWFTEPIDYEDNPKDYKQDKRLSIFEKVGKKIKEESIILKEFREFSSTLKSFDERIADLETHRKKIRKRLGIDK